MADPTPHSDNDAIRHRAGRPHGYLSVLRAVLDAVEDEAGGGDRADAALAAAAVTAHTHLATHPLVGAQGVAGPQTPR
jgi:hypothetical protein